MNKNIIRNFSHRIIVNLRIECYKSMLCYDKIYDANNDLKNKIQGPPKARGREL